MAIEVEKRGLLDKAAYNALPAMILSLGGSDAGKDDTESIFYASEEAQLKLQARPGRQTAKIAWKSGGLDGASSRQEIEVGIAYTDMAAAEKLLDKLAPDALKVPTIQKRHNFALDGANIALKYSDHWQYHIEFDVVVEAEPDVLEALQTISRAADRLQVTLLTADEEKRFIDGIVSKL